VRAALASRGRRWRDDDGGAQAAAARLEEAAGGPSKRDIGSTTAGRHHELDRGNLRAGGHTLGGRRIPAPRYLQRGVPDKAATRMKLLTMCPNSNNLLSLRVNLNLASREFHCSDAPECHCHSLDCRSITDTVRDENVPPEHLREWGDLP